MDKFFIKYFYELSNHINNYDELFLKKLTTLILETSKKKNKVIICGNGGSAATASHIAVDLTKNAKIRSINFNEADLITCFSNDYGYENWIKQSLKFYADKGDLLILISCSGNSKNLINANKFALKKKIKVVSLTGCKKNNQLNKQKNSLKFWLNSNNYNHIEIIHHLMLLSIVDRIIDINKK
jgi:D-sedoheptulose 7-phosphate isomerase